MQPNTNTAFWGAVVLSGVWAASSQISIFHIWLSTMWLIWAIVIFVIDVVKNK